MPRDITPPRTREELAFLARLLRRDLVTGVIRECDETECDQPASVIDDEGYAWCREHA